MALEEYRNLTIEFDQRRNLYVHNRGRVNRVYLERVDPALIKEYEASEGDVLAIKGDYLQQALGAVEGFGTILTQQCWRKWERGDLSSAHSFL